MSTHSGIPLAWLDVLPLRTLLQVEFALAVEHVQMHHRMQELAAAVAFTTSGCTCDVSVFINDGEEFFAVIFHCIRVLKVMNRHS